VVALVVLTALVFWAGVFAVFFTSQGTNLVEFLLGPYEPLPDDLNKWVTAGIEEQSGLVREERVLLPAGRDGGPVLLRQARFRDPTTRAIVRVRPEERVRRRRVRATR
jgi:hypothetical protein